MQISPDTVAAKVATAAQWGGAAVAGGSGGARILGLTTSEWSVVGVLSGIVVAVIGLAVNILYRERHYRLVKKRIDAEFDSLGEAD